MSAARRPPPSEGLPKQFVTSLRILFDILDENRTGYVRLCDIESRWHEEGVRGLPSGVIETLRKVTPESGYLTFETFVSGLKLSLLRNNSAVSAALNGKENRGPAQQQSSRVDRNSYPANIREGPEQQRVVGRNEQQNKPPSSYARQSRSRPLSSNTAAVRPNNVLNALPQNGDRRDQVIRSRDQMSVKQIEDDALFGARESRYSNTNTQKDKDDVQMRRRDVARKLPPRPRSEEIPLFRSRDGSTGPPVNTDRPASQAERPPARPNRPPSYERAVEKHGSAQRSPDNLAPPAVPPRDRSSRIMNELQNWKREQINRGTRLPISNSDSKLVEKNHSGGNVIYVNIDQLRQYTNGFNPAASTSSVPQKKPAAPKQNSRRHTLSSGVDYSLIRRMKQLETEKDLLLQGLEWVERTRDWYQRQIATIADKQTFLEKTSHTDTTVEASQEKLDFQRARISEVNHHLRALLDSDKGFPFHMNLAVGNNMQTTSVKMLKDQNKQLTKEVGNKSDKISQLEKEKASLIRELFEARAKNKSSYDDTTFM